MYHFILVYYLIGGKKRSSSSLRIFFTLDFWTSEQYVNVNSDTAVYIVDLPLSFFFF